MTTQAFPRRLIHTLGIRRPLSASWVVLGASVVLLLTVLAGWSAGIRWNRSPSLPAGLYWTEAPRTLERGAFVLFCPDLETGRMARERGYIFGGDCPGDLALIGKPILAIAGDEIEHDSAFIAVNGDTVPRSWTSDKDSRGRDLPHPAFGVQRLAEGQVWVHSSFHPNSFDSRYIGPVRTENIQAVLTPLWLW